MRENKPRVWCMEGSWSSSVHDLRTVAPLLDTLRQFGGESVRQPINTPEDLAASMRRWGQRQHDAFNIGYLALHGSPQKVYIGRKAVTIDELGSWGVGKLSKKVLHFGSCSVLRASPREREKMRTTLGVRAITGYTKNVEWCQSLALDLLLFEVLAHYKRIDAADRYMRVRYPDPVQLTGFVFVR